MASRVSIATPMTRAVAPSSSSPATATSGRAPQLRVGLDGIPVDLQVIGKRCGGRQLIAQEAPGGVRGLACRLWLEVSKRQGHAILPHGPHVYDVGVGPVVAIASDRGDADCH